MKIKFVFNFMLLIILSGCGGGMPPIQYVSDAPVGKDCSGAEILKSESCSGDELSAEEKKLIAIINHHRENKGLHAIEVSPNINKLANRHVQDLSKNMDLYLKDGKSWKHGWSDCPYDGKDDKTYKCMWEAPKRLGIAYPGYVFENLSTASNGSTAEGAFSSWLGSKPHYRVIVNKGVWEEHRWNAIGVGIYGKYAVMIVGREVDPETNEGERGK